MNLSEILLALNNANDNEVPVDGLEAAVSQWSLFYPELEKVMDSFIEDDASLNDEQHAILFFGTLLLAQLKYAPALEKCLQVFSRSDTFLTPIEAVFGDALTELTPTIFFNVASGNTQALSDYIVGGHQAMYCKASAIEAVFAQYEVGVITKAELIEQVNRWLAAFLALPSESNSFLLSALADACITYKLDQFKEQFIALCDKSVTDNNLIDENRFSHDEVRAWSSNDIYPYVEFGTVQTDFNVIDTLQSWAFDDELIDDDLEIFSEDGFDDFDSITGEGGLLADIMYDEQTILDNSVPVSSLKSAGRNDPCPCGSGKKYKKCCLH